MKRCRVAWEPTRFGVDAVLYSADGRSINVAHYRTEPTSTKRKRIESRLLKGCAELSKKRRPR